MDETSLGPVVVDGFVWTSITEVTIEVYLHRPGGPLTTDVDPQGDFSAFGVHNYPTSFIVC